MSEVDDRKRELRRHFKGVRCELGEEGRASIDAAIAELVATTEEWQAADVVLPYLSVGDEVDTRELIGLAWKAGKMVAIPRVCGTRQMSWHVICDFDHLEMSPMHVEEPLATAPVLDPGTEARTGKRLLALVPGLTFDARGYRLGYGGGFYDAFLAALADLGGVSIGLAREAQLSESLSDLGILDAHDLPVDIVATERHLMR